MKQRAELFLEYDRGQSDVAELCRRYSVSRKTFYKWLSRWKESGFEGLADRSSAPGLRPHALADETRRKILALRGEHPRLGSRKIQTLLRRQGLAAPASSTIHEALCDAGLVQPRQTHRRTPRYQNALREVDEPNQLWCADFKGWYRTGDDSVCRPFTLMDACSRYLIVCEHVPSESFEAVQPLLIGALRRHGMPETLRTDNGTPFASGGPAGLCRLSVWLLRLDIMPERIAPGRPQQNGRHERMHGTLQEWRKDHPTWSLSEQAVELGRFVDFYNGERPHQALGQRTPSEVHRASVRPYPSRLPRMEYDSSATLRKVTDGGQIKWLGEQLFVGKSLRSEYVAVEALGEELDRIRFGRLAVGVYDRRRKGLLNARELENVLEKRTVEMTP